MRDTQIQLRKSTMQIVRAFYQDPSLMLKIKQFGEHRSSEYAGVIDSMEQMQKLWGIKLATPKEEQVATQKAIT